jgi:hypothetical protein
MTRKEYGKAQKERNRLGPAVLGLFLSIMRQVGGAVLLTALSTDQRIKFHEPFGLVRYGMLD